MAQDNNEFITAANAGRTGIVVEFIDFLKHNKKWWLLPILLAIVLIGALVFLAANPAIAPFIYPV